VNLIDLREIPNTNNLFYIESLDSTQDLLIDLIKEHDNLHFPIGIYSFNQTNGRGQRKKDWINQKNKGLALSIGILLNDTVDVVNLNKSITLLVNEFVSAKSEQKSWIKWPNDIILNDHKAVGLLMEIITDANQNKVLVVGVGLNVLDPISEMKKVTGILNTKSISLESLQILSKTLYNSISTVTIGDGVEETYNLQLYKRNTTISLRSSENNIFKGKLKEVDSAGRLVVEVNSEIKKYHFGQARIIL